MNLRYCFVLFLWLLISPVGCSDEPQKPQQLIDEDKYINLLVELQLVRSYSQNAPTDSLTIDSLMSEVFKKYDVSGETFWDSHEYYQQFPRQQKERVEQAIERLKMDQVENTKQDEDTTATDQ